MKEHIDFGEIICAAQSGDADMLSVLIELYMPLINKYSKLDGKINEDLKQVIILKIITNLNKFKTK